MTALGAEYVNLDETKEGDWDIEEARPFAVQEGDFLVARGNGSIRFVGRGAIVGQIRTPVAFPDTLIRVHVDRRLAAIRFVAAAWQSSVVREQIEKKAKTTAGIHKINQADLRSLVLPLPPLDEQERIFAALDDALSVHESIRDAVAANLRRIDRLRQAILKWAFEGKLVDQDPNDEPAAVLLARIKAERAATGSAPARRGQPPGRKKDRAA